MGPRERIHPASLSQNILDVVGLTIGTVTTRTRTSGNVCSKLPNIGEPSAASMSGSDRFEHEMQTVALRVRGRAAVGPMTSRLVPDLNNHRVATHQAAS